MLKFFRKHQEAKRLQKLTNDSEVFEYSKGLCKVVSVYDGDTCKVLFFLPGMKLPMRRSVRLYGIDTPELRPPLLLPDREQEILQALSAKARLAELVENKVVTYIYRDEDKYGRFLVSLYTPEGENVADILIRENLGVQYFGGKKKVKVIEPETTEPRVLPPELSLQSAIQTNLQSIKWRNTS